jgi:hypothetical protein
MAWTIAVTRGRRVARPRPVYTPRDDRSPNTEVEVADQTQDPEHPDPGPGEAGFGPGEEGESVEEGRESDESKQSPDENETSSS